MKLKIDSIQTEAGTQTRVKINEDAVTEYAEAMENGAEFPPVTVFHDGTDYWMADGFHRIMAAARNGFVDIEAEVRKGTKRDALIYALGANTANGLRRTPDDKRRCVKIALAEFPDWSDRRIAEACGVSDMFVGKVRREVQTVCTSTPTTRTGKDGKQYPAKRESRGWTAPEVKAARPEPSRNVNKVGGARECHSSIGMMYADSAIMQLEKIPRGDIDRRPALERVAAWVLNSLKEA